VTRIALRMHNRLESKEQCSSKCDIVWALPRQIPGLKNLVPFDSEYFATPYTLSYKEG
jgi:hypothetical protein